MTRIKSPSEVIAAILARYEADEIAVSEIIDELEAEGWRFVWSHS